MEKSDLRKLSQVNFVKLVTALVLILFTAAYTLPWIVKNSLGKEYSGVDLHGYWYAGHFTRQGVNPYAAILNDTHANYWDPRVPGSGDPNLAAGAEVSLKLPIYYLDGHVVRKHPVAQTMIVVPSVAAPLNLLLGLLSWFSWPIARLIWLIFNLLFAAAIPWLAIRLVDRHWVLSWIDKFIFAFIFYNFYGLRQSMVVGQQTLVCLFLLILALLVKKKWLIAGLLLGFGISKYSVGLPVFIYFLLQKRFRAALAGVMIQGIAILLLLPLKFGSPVDTLSAYFKVFEVNFSQTGVPLLARFSESEVQAAIFVAVLCLTVLLLARQYRSKITGPAGQVVRLNGLNLITLATFLITYHRVHDMPFMIFFLLPVITAGIEQWNLTFSQVQLAVLIPVIIIIIFLLLFPTLPVYILQRINGLPKLWISVEASSTVSLILMFALSMWFQLRLFPKNTQAAVL